MHHWVREMNAPVYVRRPLWCHHGSFRWLQSKQ